VQYERTQAAIQRSGRLLQTLHSRRRLLVDMADIDARLTRLEHRRALEEAPLLEAQLWLERRTREHDRAATTSVPA
jgi:hypothetical protein